MRAAAMESVSAEDGTVQHATRLDRGWQFRQGEIGGIQEAWNSDQNGQWQPVGLPHCFNGMDSCDPDRSYFRGQGWYRTRLPLRNPFAGGRTILHFQGAGQTTTLWVGSTLIGTHKGGYDEFVFDITEAVQKLPLEAVKAGVPLAVLCDNSPDRDRVPSEQSDFCLFGGLYRHVNLAYLPAVALDTVHILPTIAPDGSAQVSVDATLYNPSGQKAPCRVSIEVFDAQGRSVHQSSKSLSAWSDFARLAEFHVAAPELWSPDSPGDAFHSRRAHQPRRAFWDSAA
jgi:beta-galactosidase